MKPIIATERMDICLAQKGDIHQIIVLEESKENRRFIWQGSYEDHLKEIECEDTYLLTLKKKSCEGLLGFALCSLDKRSDSFELRRIAVSEKGRGYGREAIRGIMDYSFNTLESNRFWLDVYPHNEVGIHLYRSLGMTLEGRLRQSCKGEEGYLDQFIFSILREEYRKEKIKKSLK
ncbi:GCN5 family N-acetyltransferase [Propionigenium maris DSM 9537]|uniref:GCN5 family N-acetyltransferase n=1 Tax=Propionigenium maris DSM 9537 TaxID=1123000 RepID=A0A9W6GMP2_9FUSO|nr:GNAT family N-acetyltransferase [Propionigenium maris]GLI57298.1 GCN5 family N-acetyltransferase [Propionigenium maris DSM 9537]